MAMDNLYTKFEDTGYIACEIYTGKLGNGSKSPGVVMSINGVNRAGAYICPRNRSLTKNARGDVGSRSIPSDGAVDEASWADQNVKLVAINNASSFMRGVLELKEKCYVLVAKPWGSVTSGIFVLKGGQKPEMAVPDGASQDDINRLQLVDPNVGIDIKMQLGAARYGNPNEPAIGIPLVVDHEFPADGSKWIR